MGKSITERQQSISLGKGKKNKKSGYSGECFQKYLPSPQALKVVGENC